MSAAPRVLVVLGGIPLYGAELATIDVGAMLRDAGASVRFVTNAHWGHVAVAPRLQALGLPHEGLVFFGSVERGIRPRRLLALLRLQLSENWRLWRILRRFDPTHVHLASHWDALNLWPALALSSARLVFHLLNTPVLRHPVLRAFWRVVLRRAEVLVAVSPHLAMRCAEAGLAPRRLEVIPNRPPRRAPGGASEPPRRLAGTMFVQVGQVAEHKGSGHVVDAIARLAREGHDVGCWVLGDVASPWARALRDRVAAGALAGRIRFEGYVDDPAPWFAAADVHLAPSLSDEAFGIVVAEAKAAGRPSIVYADGALPALVADGEEGRVVARGLETVGTIAPDAELRLRVVTALPPDGVVDMAEGVPVDGPRLLGRLERALERYRGDPRKVVVHLPLPGRGISQGDASRFGEA